MYRGWCKDNFSDLNDVGKRDVDFFYWISRDSFTFHIFYGIRDDKPGNFKYLGTFQQQQQQKHIYISRERGSF